MVAPASLRPDARRKGVLALVAVNLVVAAALVQGLGPLVLLVAIAWPVGLAVLQRPQRGVLLLVALAPFDGLSLIVPLGPLEWWKEVLVILTLAATFVAPAEERGSPGRPLPAWLPAAVGFLLLGVASALFVGGTQAIVGLKITYFFLLLAYAIWRCPLTAKDRDRLVTILMVVGVVTALIGILQQLVGPAGLVALGYQYDTTVRTTGGFLRSFSTFNQPFPFGFFLMLVVLVGLPQAFTDPRRIRNQLFLLALPILGLGLASSFVRGAWLGLAIGIAYLGSSRYRAMLLVIPLAFAGLLLLPLDLAETALSERSSEQRVEAWAANFDQIVEQPLGAGLGASGAAAERAAALKGEVLGGLFQFQPDNYYFKIALELGALGLWVVVLLLVSSFVAARDESRRTTGTDSAFASSVAAMVLAAIGGSFVATYFEIFPMDLYFWVLLAVVAAWQTESR